MIVLSSGVMIESVSVYVVSVVEPSSRRCMIVLGDLICVVFTRPGIVDIVPVRIAIIVIVGHGAGYDSGRHVACDMKNLKQITPLVPRLKLWNII